MMVSMNNVVVVLAPTSVVNTYNIPLMVQAALRYPANTPLSDLSRPHSTTSNDFVYYHYHYYYYYYYYDDDDGDDDDDDYYYYYYYYYYC